MKNTPIEELFLKKFWEISLILNENICVFPQDVPFKQTYTKHFKNADTYSLSSIQMSVHCGTHIDAPIHYHPQGKEIEFLDLKLINGICYVIKVNKSDTDNIGRIQASIINNLPKNIPRIFFKTDSFVPYGEWNENFFSLSPQLIDKLADRKCQLIGIDTPSIDPSNEKILQSHLKLYEHNIWNIECLDLQKIPSGVYDLLSLPLKIQGSEAATINALLFEL